VRFISKLTIGTKLNLFFFCILILFAGVMFTFVSIELEEGIKAAALEKAKSDLALGGRYLNEKYPGDWTVRDGLLYKGETKINDNYDLVDEIGQLTGGDTVTIFQGDTRVTTNVLKEDRQRAVGTKVSEKVANVVLKEGKTFYGEANVVGKFYQAAYEPLTNSSGEIIGIWYVGAPQSLIDTTLANVMKTFGVVLVGAILIALLFVAGFTRFLKKRLNAIATALMKAGEGDFTCTVNDRVQDEIGQISTHFNQMCQQLRQLVNQVSQTAQEVSMAAGNLSAGAEQISQATQHISQNISEVAAGTETQVHSVGSSLQAVQEISANAQHIAANAHDASVVATSAAEKATEGTASIENAIRQMDLIQHTMKQLSQVVQGLGERSQEIGQIIEVITSIADQTNLLALNAAIEAARAGDHGRGFAVVADEVRKLAEQSSQSAQQISLLISAIQQETVTAVEAMTTGSSEVTSGIQVVNAAGSSFTAIQSAIRDVAEKIQEVSAAAQQMTASTEQVVEVVSVISKIAGKSASRTQNVSAASEEQLASMQEITSSAISLSRISDQLLELTAKFRS
jgi:methyl-accepting chemotaxis protein